MDWIERLFHISPDGGNGYFEYLIATVVLAVAYALRHRVRRRLIAAYRHFVEDWFGTSRDGGSGGFEALYTTLAVGGIAARVFRRGLLRWRRARRRALEPTECKWQSRAS